jgi:carboxyl-terminal processing protease
VTNSENLCLTFEAASFCAKECLDRLVDHLQANSLRSWLHTVAPENTPCDWKAYRTEVQSALKDQAAYIGGFDDLVPIIRLALQKLGDHHSVYVGQIAQRRLTKGEVEEQYPSGMLIGRNTGYLLVRETTHGFNQEYNFGYAQRLLGAIRHLEQHGASNWIVDLRDNSGGNVWPMLAGLSPLLGDGPYGHFAYKNGLVPYGLHDVTSLGYDTFKLRTPGSISVLIGKNTASSGELVCTAFMGRSDTSLIGQATSGLTTINSPYEVWNGHYIYYTSGVLADRDRNLLGAAIEPDLYGPKLEEGDRDSCLELALQSFTPSRRRTTMGRQPN